MNLSCFRRHVECFHILPISVSFQSCPRHLWFYEVLKYPRSHRMVVLNGVAMAVVFFGVRIAVMPSYWASVFATFGTPEFERLGLGAQVAWITSCIALDVLNTIWMYKIARGCYKVLTGRGGRKVKDDSDGSFTSDKKHANNHTD
ncbi:TLC domain-containing protein 4-B [Xenoophorus captivus]|uniref:TLC domain-containing protein 4-B n=1 Tax=Xenoophorus captivus TaxID=1517983 RepID=A0ABV0QGE6_9TELE